VRVLLIADWQPGRGGSEAYIAWLRDGLARAGDEVRLLTSSAGTAGDGTADHVAYGTLRPSAQVVLQVVNPFAIARVRSVLGEFRPDVAFVSLFLYHLSPAILHALRGVPVVLGVVDYKVICPVARKLLPDGSLCDLRAGWVCYRKGCVGMAHWIRDRPRYALIRNGLKRVDRILACSRWVQQELARDGIASDWVTLPVPVPSPEFRRRPDLEPLFLYVGRLSIEKGVPGLLRAFARVRAEVPAARLRVVGDGPEKALVERLTLDLGLADAVDRVGWLDPPAVEQELERAWASVAPSLWAEPLGLVALEAIVRGVPVIASEKGGFGETVEPGISGLLFPNGDEDALAARMLEVARRSAFPDQRIPERAVRRAAERHAMERHIERMRGIFAAVGNGGGAPPA
jgi:glycosyltransferase involved in cell wall biosynthesis